MQHFKKKKKKGGKKETYFVSSNQKCLRLAVEMNLKKNIDKKKDN